MPVTVPFPDYTFNKHIFSRMQCFPDYDFSDDRHKFKNEFPLSLEKKKKLLPVRFSVKFVMMPA